MRYVLGLDGGGSKTECVVAREDGEIFGRARGGGVNRNFISEEGFEQSVHDAVQGALDTAPQVTRVERVVGSMGCDGRSMREIAARYMLPHDHMRWVGESLPARASAEITYGRTPDIVIVAGTGSLVSGWGRDGTQRGVGGAGCIVGDEGSAYWIGVRALTHVVECYDGRRPWDDFSQQLTTALEIPNHHTLINRVYGFGKRPMTRDEMAAVAPHVSRLANAGDAFACQLFRGAAHELVFQAEAVIRMLKLQDEPVLIQLYGGCFRAGAVISEPLREEIVVYAPRAELLPPLKCTVIGAAAMALRDAGVDVSTAAVRQRLLEGGRRYDVI
jgi:N-acetylglucosamine kinase-like BadF-type ATPase